ncbi:MAG: hypothetical protein JRN51_11535 [Nitrososphaerota archaeon]|nr:hypothetical protein [Nitrososphaerota archaeon]
MSVFDLVSGIIALLVSYYAFSARRLIASSVLSALSFGFMLLGAALLVEVVTNLSLGITAAAASTSRTFVLLEDLAYLVLQLAAFLIIAGGYARMAYGGAGLASGVLAALKPRAAQLAGAALLLYYLFLGLEFAILLTLVFIIFQGFLVYTRSRDRSAFLVMLAFALIFLGHVVVLRSILDISGVEYLVAAAIQFLGFLSLLAFVVRSGRVGSA